MYVIFVILYYMLYYRNPGSYRKFARSDFGTDEVAHKGYVTIDCVINLTGHTYIYIYMGVRHNPGHF